MRAKMSSPPGLQTRTLRGGRHLHAPGLLAHQGTGGVASPSLPADWPGDFFCPCHGSIFDGAGRVFKNKPAPTNLEISPYRFTSDSRIVVGTDTAASTSISRSKTVGADNARTGLCIELRLQVRHVRYRTDYKCVQRDDRGDEAVIPVRSASAAILARNPLGGSPLELNRESNHLHRRPCRHRLVHCRVFRPALSPSRDALVGLGSPGQYPGRTGASPDAARANSRWHRYAVS